jgi:Mor family transcriptional regulator
MKVADLTRKYGVSEQSIYRCQAKYGGMTVSEAKRSR